MQQPRTQKRALGALLVVVLTTLLIGVPAFAQEDDEQRLEELKAEREALQVELAAQATLVDASVATFDEVIKALDDINALVDLQQARLADAEQAVAAAQTQVTLAEERQLEIEAERSTITQQVADLAVAAFTGEGGANGEDLTAFLSNSNPTEAARRRSLVEFQTGNLADAVDRLDALSAEAERVEAERVAAVEEATNNRAKVLSRQTEVAAAEAAQIEIVIAAEARLESRLAEALGLDQIDANLAADIQRQEEAIARRIREEARRKAAAEAARRAKLLPPPASRDDMVNAEGFIVHRDIGDTVGRMIRAAAADGVTLSGYGYRSSQRTAELRIINGCPDVNTSSASSCRIPTARPGQSMHEFGKAIDFSSCWRGSACFNWLSRNASSYGFINLPSESWHWSVNGR
ncbi:MAG: hypothetical protein HKN94_10775 [Acidimicrobiales bacterium]|nr:hypothetical protein [Acidimicrobiales bacterium]